MAIIIVLVLTAVVAGLIAIPGGGLFALIVVPIGLALAGWLAFAGRARTAPSDLARREAPHGEFLGPGGPDDPDR